MKRFNSILIVLLIGVVMASFSQCSSAKDLQKKAPLEMDQVYFQRWVAGVEGGGAGLNLFIPVKDSSVKLDSVYFRGKGTKLDIKPGENLYVGRFISDFNKPKDMVVHADPKMEYGNEMPEIPKESPFKLKDDECVVSYADKGKTKYFKIDNIVEKDMLAYPSAPPDKQ